MVRSLEMQFERFEDAAQALKALQTIREDLKVKQLGPDDSGQYFSMLLIYFLVGVTW